MRASLLSTPLLLLSALCFAPSVQAVNWIDGATRTIEYTQGVNLGVIYVETDVDHDGHSISAVTIVSGAVPSGVNFHNAGPCPSNGKLCTAFSGTPLVSTLSTVVVRANDFGPTDDITITFQPALSLTGSVTSTGIVGGAYSSSISAVGGVAPLTWSISAGALPPGLSINASTGVISGTPTTSGPYNFTVQLVDSLATTKTSAQSILIYDALSVTTSLLADTSVGGTFSATLAASGGTTPRTWSIAAGALPLGLSLNASTGAITGTPTTAGVANFTVQVDCCSTGTAQAVLSILVNLAPSITTSSLSDGTVGQAYSQTLVSALGTGAHTWSIASGALPAGLSLNPSTGAITGTPSAGGTANFTVEVTDGASATDSQALSIFVQAGPTITTSALTAVTVGQSVSASLGSTGGTGPFTWSISAGALPVGISVNASTGALTGTPTAAETASFTARVVDNNVLDDTQALSWTVNAAPSITTSSLAETTVGAAYSQTVSATGGTGALTFSVSAGALPTGLSLNPSSGAITGTASADGTASFTVTATDTNSVEGSAALSITVNPAPSVTTTTLPDAVRDAVYSQTLSSIAGTGAHTWSIASGALPSGLTLNPSTGAITGTPTTPGTASFTVQVQDALSVTDTQALSLTVLDGPTITTSSLTAVTVGQSVSASLGSTGGTGPFTWSISAGALPVGISLNASTGALTGTPTAAGTANFTARVVDNNVLDDTQALSWTVNAAPSITTSSLAETTVGAAYSQTVSATGGTGALTFSVSAGALPTGLSLNPSSGAITGTASADGTASFTVTATDTNSVEGSAALSITVNPAPEVTTTTLPDAVRTVAYSQTLSATGGSGAHTWSVTSGALPAGLSLNPSTGAITGVPTVAGDANFTVQVQDALSITDTQALTLTVLDGPTITTTALDPITVGQTVAEALQRSSGTAPFTWSISSGALPAGLSLNPSTGALTGTPTADGAASFTARVEDDNGLDDTQALSWTVNAAPSFSTSSLPQSTVGASYSETVAASNGTGSLTYSLHENALPDGLSLNPSTGAITGLPSVAGEFPFSLKVSDENGVEATQVFTIVINAAPEVTTTSLPFGVKDAAYEQTLAASGGTPDLTWSILSGSLPAGLNLNSSTGAIAGTPTTTGVSNFFARVTDSEGITDDQALSIEVFDNPVVTTSVLDPVTVGQSVSTSVAASHGTEPYSWDISAGALPAGVSLGQATGDITGTPTSAGQATFTVRVTDDNGLVNTKELTWTVNTAPEIDNTELPETTVNRPLPNVTLTATGGTGGLTWNGTGMAPGVTVGQPQPFAPQTAPTRDGLMSGTPTQAGEFTVTLTATDENAVSGEKQLALVVNPPPSVSTSSLPRGTVGVAYSQALAADDGTGEKTWTLTVGSLPAGLTLSAAGAISGTPTTVDSKTFTVQVADAAGATATKELTLEVVDPLEVTTTALPVVTAGQTLNIQLEADGGAQPFSWSVVGGSLPSGVTLGEANGVLGGASLEDGVASFSVRVSDADGRTHTKSFNWEINQSIQITTTALDPATVDEDYEDTLTATGGTGALTWSVDVLPPGIVLDPATGKVSGQFLTDGDPVMVFTATDENGEHASRSLTLRVYPAIEITTSEIEPFEKGEYAQLRLRASGGSPKLTWSASAPAGLRLRSDGMLMGTPTQAGTSSMKVRVFDANGARADRTFEVVVEEEVGYEVSPSQLSFEAVEGGGPTAPKQVAVTSTPAGQPFEVDVDASWLSVSLDGSVTPAVLDVAADPAGLDPGEYASSITLPGTDQAVAVSLTVTPEVDPTLTVAPESLSVSVLLGGESESRLVAVRTEGDPGDVVAEVGPGAPWLSVVVRPGAGGEEPEAFLTVGLDPGTLADGEYEGVVSVVAGELSVDIPVLLTVSGADFELSHSGLTFEAIVGGADPPAEVLRVLDLAPEPLEWQAEADAPWVQIAPTAGLANPLSEIEVEVDKGGLEPGSHTAVLTVSGPGGESRETTIRLNLDEAEVDPQVAPTGLLFHSLLGVVPGAQPVHLSYGGDTAMGFVQAVAPMEASWLTVTPTTGSVPAGGVATLTVDVDPLGLAVGEHEAAISIELDDGTVRVVRVTLVVSGEACEPTKLVPVFTKLGDHFTARQGWPSPVEVRVADNCGNAVSEGAGLLELSVGGEPAIALLPAPDGLWTATWTPNDDHASVTMTATVENGDRTLVGSVQVTGAVEPDGAP